MPPDTLICMEDGCPWGGKPIPVFQIQKLYRKKPQQSGTICLKCACEKQKRRDNLKRNKGRVRCGDCDGTPRGFNDGKAYLCRTCSGSGWVQKTKAAPSRGGFPRAAASRSPTPPPEDGRGIY